MESRDILIVLTVLVALALVATQVYNQASGAGAACTQEARVCPDGSSVGRIPPRCEFAPCPSSNLSGATNGTISSFDDCVDAGYVVEGTSPQRCKTAEGRVFLNASADGNCSNEAIECWDGSFSMQVPPECGFAACPEQDYSGIASFEECAAAGFAVIGSDPPTCSTPDGKVFMKNSGECPQDAKLCANGAYVGRVAPECEFAPCPEVNYSRITTFAECIASGFAVEGTNGTECKTPDRRLFIYSNETRACEEDVKSCILCPEDLLECADGSYVGRVPPACRFVPCPPAAEGNATPSQPEIPLMLNNTGCIDDIPPCAYCSQDIMKCADGSYVGRVPPYCEFEACP